MSAPFRIKRPDTGLVPVARRREENFKFYLDRLLKMIPGEVVGLYLVGNGFIPGDQIAVQVIWLVVCLVGVIVIRAYGTTDPENNAPPDWVHVAISSIAFLIWAYTLGGPFVGLGWHIPYIGSLLVLTWTFFVPILYKGPMN